MSEVEPIPQVVLRAARLKLCRKVGAMFVRAMAETGDTYETLGEKLGVPAKTIRHWVISLVDGKARDLDQLSDICLALEAEPVFQLTCRPAVSPPTSEAAA